MKQRSSWFLYLLLPLLVGSCATRRIHGQVLVVTEGGRSVALGGVRVLLFPENVMLEHLANRDRGYAAELARAREENAEAARVVAEGDAIADSLEALRATRLRVELERAEADLARAGERARKSRRDAQDAAKTYADAHERRMGTATPEQIVSGAVDPVEERRRMGILAEAADRAEAAESSSRERVARLKAGLPGVSPRGPFVPLPAPEKTAKTYFEELPSPVATAETDAEGRFTLRIPGSGRWVIAAHGERTVRGAVENYYWMVRVPRGGEGELLLDDSCRTNSGSPLSLIDVEGGN